MNSLLPEEIDSNEWLYRGVVAQNWVYAENRPSTAIFKDSKGVSVDRDGERTETEIISALFLSGKTFKAIVKVQQKFVNEVGAITKYKPTPHNIFHSEIHKSAEVIELTRSQQKNLLKVSQQVYINSSL